MINETCDEQDPAFTGRWYSTGRINVTKKMVKIVPWKSGTLLNATYDENTCELKLKPLKY